MRNASLYEDAYFFGSMWPQEFMDVEALAESIGQDGQFEPGLVIELAEPDGEFRYEIVFGHRRGW